MLAVIDAGVLEAFLAHLLVGDRRACRADVQGLLERSAAPRALYEQLFQPALYAVGDRWQRGEISVAVEHLATAITEDLLGLVFPRALGAARLGRTAVVTCAADEFHQVGGRIVADSLEAAGWRAHFLGANGKPEALLALVRDARPELLALSVTIPANAPLALRMVKDVRTAAPKLPIIVGGQALAGEGLAPFQALPGVTGVRTLGELDGLLASWGA